MTGLLNKAYSEIENCPFDKIVEESLGSKLPLSDDRSPTEIKFGSRFFRMSLDPVGSQEETASYIFIVAETTKQKLAEEALLISERLAATGRMAHTIAHEINNPLEAITNLLYLLQSSLEKPEIARSIFGGCKQ